MITTNLNYQQKSRKPEFPYLARLNNFPYLARLNNKSDSVGTVVLFVAENTGMVVESRTHEIGSFCDNWVDEKYWEVLPKGNSFTFVQD